jgi:hypothetical protein
VIPAATSILEDIAVHGGRAPKRWPDRLNSLPVTWHDLETDQKDRYLDFVQIAACQLTVANINPGAS